MQDTRVASFLPERTYPPHVLECIERVRQAGGAYSVQPLFFVGKYVGYRVRFRVGAQGSFVDVTGLTSFGLPFEDALQRREPGTKPKDLELARRLMWFVAPPRAGLAGLQRAVREQLVLYRAFRHREGGVVV